SLVSGVSRGSLLEKQRAAKEIAKGYSVEKVIGYLNRIYYEI
ncbi:glycosyl transferase family 1, partial [Porphyromonas gingivalis]